MRSRRTFRTGAFPEHSVPASFHIPQLHGFFKIDVFPVDLAVARKISYDLIGKLQGVGKILNRRGFPVGMDIDH